jgi:hypothetical protein
MAVYTDGCWWKTALIFQLHLRNKKPPAFAGGFIFKECLIDLMTNDLF